jgi:hypothetical protein|tara:strand:+ start:94 stop:651 length:558 start_codon:yes stop_codon:yes gene_type:complete
MSKTTIPLGTGVTGTLGVANGGTGLSSGTSGQFLKFTGGTTLASSADNGKIAQVLGVQKTDKASTSSTSYADISGLSQAITPSATSSKILAMVSIKGIASDNSTTDALSLRLMRDSTEISEAANITYGSTEQDNQSCAIIFLDSPSSTSELTYHMEFKSRLSNSSSINNTTPETNSELVVMEVLA